MLDIVINIRINGENNQEFTAEISALNIRAHQIEPQAAVLAKRIETVIQNVGGSLAKL